MSLHGPSRLRPYGGEARPSAAAEGDAPAMEELQARVRRREGIREREAGFVEATDRDQIDASIGGIGKADHNLLKAAPQCGRCYIGQTPTSRHPLPRPLPPVDCLEKTTRQ